MKFTTTFPRRSPAWRAAAWGLTTLMFLPVRQAVGSAEERAVWRPLADAPAVVEDSFQHASRAYGITPFFNYWGTVQGNPAGGRAQSAAYAHEILFGATFDMERLARIPGAKFQISAGDGAGSNLSEAIGNFFTVSQAYVTPTVLFYELWWEQDFFGEAASLRFGRVTSSEFASIPAFGLQVSGGLDGNPASLFANTVFTSSPNATWGARLRVNPTHSTRVMAGIYQATDRLGNPAYHGLDFSIRSNDAPLIFAEIGWEPVLGEDSSRGLTGHYKFGGYYSTFPFERFDGNGAINNTYGFYWLAQQMVWRAGGSPDQHVSLWGGVTWSPQEQVALMPVMGFAGAIWQGLIPGRSTDQLLLTWMSGGFSRAFAATTPRGAGVETVFEVSYVFNVTENIFIQPDLQYILRPYGDPGIEDALVIGFQIGCLF